MGLVPLPLTNKFYDQRNAFAVFVSTVQRSTFICFSSRIFSYDAESLIKIFELKNKSSSLHIKSVESSFFSLSYLSIVFFILITNLTRKKKILIIFLFHTAAVIKQRFVSLIVVCHVDKSDFVRTRLACPVP